MPAYVFVGLLALVCVAQVIIDLFVAPHEDDEETHGHIMVDGRYDDHDDNSKRKKRPDISDAYRRGTPSELRRNFYFFFMEGSWTRLFAFFAFSYLFVNIIFAALYMLEPGSLANVNQKSFSDAFFFSVQTISTIGFGAISPASDYGNTLVTIEAIFGIIMVALVTGMVFAKASRPVSSVLFSNILVVTRKDGKDVLMLRLGNARGNDVVDAAVKVAVLVDRTSPEGHHFRSFADIDLVRSTTPVFALSWSVMHEIDESSPFWGCDWSKPDQFFRSLIVIMTGHDSTYAQTTHARKIYYPEDLKPGHRFRDIISTMTDGRFMIDYTKFHQTVPDEAFTGSRSPSTQLTDEEE